MDKALKEPAAVRNGAVREIGSQPGHLREVGRGWATYGPEEAKAALENCRYPNQRTISTRHVVFLAEQMLRGEFSGWGNEIVFATSEPGGERWLVDGQHRLRAIIRSGRPQRLQTLELAGSRESIAEFYYHLDRGRPRNGLNDCVPSAEIANRMGVSMDFLRRCRSGLKLLCLGLTGEGSNNHKNFASVRDTKTMLAVEQLYSSTILQLREEVFGGEIKHDRLHTSCRLMAFPCLSIMLGTVRYSPDKAIPFWREAATASKKRGNISRDFADWTLSATGKHDNDIRRRKMLAAAAAWNEHASGRNRNGFNAYIQRLMHKETRTEDMMKEWLNEGSLDCTPIIPSMELAADPDIQEIIEAGLRPAEEGAAK